MTVVNCCRGCFAVDCLVEGCFWHNFTGEVSRKLALLGLFTRVYLVDEYYKPWLKGVSGRGVLLA